MTSVIGWPSSRSNATVLPASAASVRRSSNSSVFA
jgi:hypothetical protein